MARSVKEERNEKPSMLLTTKLEKKSHFNFEKEDNLFGKRCHNQIVFRRATLRFHLDEDDVGVAGLQC